MSEPHVCNDSVQISTPLGVGHLSRALQGQKFKIPLPRSFVPRELACQVLWTSTQRVLNMLTPHERTDGRTHARTQAVVKVGRNALELRSVARKIVSEPSLAPDWVTGPQSRVSGL